jgi:uncharacterized protein (TIGR02217 family)
MSFTQRAVVTTSNLATDADVFPAFPGQGFMTTKRPVWSTIKKMAYSGRQLRAQAFAYPRWEFVAAYEVLRDTASYLELQGLYGFLGSRLGGAIPFYYWDPYDNTVSLNAFGQGDGSTTVFNVYRSVGVGTIFNYLDRVLVFRNNPSIYINGTLKTLGTDYTIGINGVITFASAPASGAALTWSGSFLYLCEFDDDMVDAAQVFVGAWSLGKLSFSSMKP